MLDLPPSGAEGGIACIIGSGAKAGTACMSGSGAGEVGTARNFRQVQCTNWLHLEHPMWAQTIWAIQFDMHNNGITQSIAIELRCACSAVSKCCAPPFSSGIAALLCS